MVIGNGLAVIVDLHWTSSSPGSGSSHQQTPMPNRVQTPTLWSSVANKFKVLIVFKPRPVETYMFIKGKFSSHF